MTAQQYRKISAPFRKSRDSVLCFNLLNTVLTAIVYIAYPSLLAYLIFSDRTKLLRSILIPAGMLLFVSGLRRVINRPRPYETLNIRPLINKDKKGQSMPSRHIFSVFMIAMTFLYVKPVLSIPLFVVGVLLCAVRVIGGVHYLSDVLVGTAIGIASGIFGYFVF